MIQKTPLTESPQAPASRRLLRLAAAARIMLWITITAWILFGASWGVLHGWIVPRIGEFRPRIEIEAGKALGMPVRIGQISARSEGLIPSFELRDVTLMDAQGREVLRLARVLAALSPSSLWARGFEQLSIDRPVLEIRRARDGKIYVGGVDISGTGGDANRVADWVFSQAELSVQGGTARWVDEMHGIAPLELTQVNAVLRNSHRRHLMRLDATPSANWGEHFSLRGIFRQPLLSRDAGRWRDWSGQIYAAFDRVDVSQLKQYAKLDKLQVDLQGGNGSLRAWADIGNGQITSATADVALRDVGAQWFQAPEPLALEFLSGRFNGRRLADGFEFTTEGMLFTTGDGLHWPGGNLAVVHSGGEQQTEEKTELKADRLDLAALAAIAVRLPLGTATQAAIISYAPKGLVEKLDARWQGPVNASSVFSAKGRVAGLSLASVSHAASEAQAPAGAGPRHAPGRPGISGAAIDFDLSQAGGKANVNIAHGSLDLPGIFEESRIALDSLSMDAQWKLAGGKVETQLRNIKFSGPDAEGMAEASWRSSAAPGQSAGAAAEGTLGMLDLQGSLSRGDGARVHRYLPLVLPDGVRHYVRDAVLEGTLSEVNFRVKGPVDRIPYPDPASGEFKVSAKVSNGAFAYVPNSVQPKGAQAWPALADVRGELLFHRTALEINGASGKVAGLPGLQVLKADARIADLMHAATLEVTASLKGPLAEALGFVNSSPVGSMTGQVLGQAVANGSADYGLHLNLPLKTIENTRIQGTISLPGNDVQLVPAAPVLERLKGVATFSETGFNIAAAQARLLGGDTRFEGGMRAPPRSAAGPDAEPSIAFRAQGNISADGIRQAARSGLALRLAQSAGGGTAYSATLAFRRNKPEIVVSSNLQGLSLGLPPPFGKVADSALPVRFEKTLLRESLQPGQKLQDQVSLTVGRTASIVYVRDVSASSPRVVRGSIGVGLETGEASPLPESGVSANINLVTADVDAWAKVLAASGAPAAAAGPPGARDDFADAASDYMPTQIAVRARQLMLDGRKLNNVVAGGSREGNNWRANIDAAELNGYVEFRQPGSAGEGRVYARLSRLNLAPAAASDVETIIDEQPSSIPSLDIVVDELELRGKKLGRVEIDAVNRGTQASQQEGGIREWRLNKFNIILPEAVLTASGNWVAVNSQLAAGVLPAQQGPTRPAAERRRVMMNFKLDISDSGELLTRFGMDGVIRRGKGKMEGQVAWLGSPLSPDYPSMNGKFNVNIESGQFLKADPGIAKLLGVLSLQALPRRLTLDFRDVFSEGFAFDFVRGDVSISHGTAATNNLQMKGVNAAVLMEGSANIAREMQDIKVVVVPEINAGTASLIATVINPAIGLGTFLAQYFLRRPLIQATTQEFHIDGSWADPRITKVERKP